jgi:hypothetical protein
VEMVYLMVKQFVRGELRSFVVRVSIQLATQRESRELPISTPWRRLYGSLRDKVASAWPVGKDCG